MKELCVRFPFNKCEGYLNIISVSEPKLSEDYLLLCLLFKFI